ncbi:MAG: 3-keto-disaccharide hydrolase [bacterium]|jgi:hypothetical protein
MKNNRYFMLLSILFALMITVCGVDAGENQDEGWIPLFNGKDLEGWRQINGTADYKVEDGVIVGTTKEGSPNSFLCTLDEYCNFELKFEVKVDDPLNSGVQVRSHSYPGYKNGRVHGYQVEIEAQRKGGDEPGSDAGYIYDEARRGWLSQERNKRDVFKNGEWNEYRVLCQGNTIKTWINGEPITEVTDDVDDCGFIALQVHSFRGDKPAQVRWRNLYIKIYEYEYTFD